jgi:hypothetical protein
MYTQRVEFKKQITINGFMYKGTSQARNLLFYTPTDLVHLEQKGKAIPETGRGGPQGSETSRLPHFLENRLKDGGEIVSLTRSQPFLPQEDSWYSFLSEPNRLQGRSASGRIKSIDIFHDLIQYQTRDLPVCSTPTFTVNTNLLL